jgi:hypothetical protein
VAAEADLAAVWGGAVVPTSTIGLGQATLTQGPGQYSSIGPEPVPPSNLPGTPVSGGVDYVAGAKGNPVAIPEGYEGRVADNGKGLVYQPAGATGNADAIRIADPDGRYPIGYARFYNQYGQPVIPWTGAPGSKADTHFPLDYELP